jgi:DNA-binding transcriptional MerR regulator
MKNRFPLLRKHRRNPPKAKPQLRLEGFTAAELGAKVGVSARTVRYYTAQHVLPSPQFRGSATRYLREHLLHLAAIRALQRERRCSLAAIRRELAPLDAAALERLAAKVLPELATPAALAQSQPPTPPPSSLPLTDAWHRLTLVPGLELHVHAAASSEVRALARHVMASVQNTLSCASQGSSCEPLSAPPAAAEP